MFDKQKVVNLFHEKIGSNPVEIGRMRTGLCHYVYYIKDENANEYIIRISNISNRNMLKGSIYWLEILQNLDIPVPEIIAEGINCQIPFLILSYIPGDDLGNVYNDLSEDNKIELAHKMIEIQARLEEFNKMQIPYYKRYGYLSSLDDKDYKENWIDVITDHISRSEKRISNNEYFDCSYIDITYKLINKYYEYLRDVKAVPFLHDATTKNVLVEDAKLSGIIDLDSICFGDSLYQISLTKMSLIASDYDTNYVDYWISELKLNEYELKILNLYTIIFCVDFMSETGIRFNKEIAEDIDQERITKLKDIFNALYNSIL